MENYEKHREKCMKGLGRDMLPIYFDYYSTLCGLDES